ncbi:hypothetical protein SBRCBS47491_003955 [Sporothrix bragantina]|uniref:chitinase n=1 Tax=Sporothrix bragantina TaxID=671064 RepID=A0ABP0BJE8_9PEZI
MLPSWITSAAAAGYMLLSSGLIDGVEAGFKLRQPASPGYRSRSDNCPTSCSVTGFDPSNWPAYNSLQDLGRCQETIFYHLSLYDDVDDWSPTHRIFACTSYGALTSPGAASSNMDVQQTETNATFTVGHWDENAPSGVDLRSLSKQVRKFLTAGYQITVGGAVSDSSSKIAQTLFAQTKKGTVGLYIGKDVQSASYVVDALQSLENSLTATNETTGTVAMELCGTGYDADHVIGFIATSNTSFAPVQQVLQSWSNATCLDFNSTQTFTSPVGYTAPLVVSSGGLNNTSNSTSLSARGLSGRMRFHAHNSLTPRADCTTIQVVSGDSCGTLATKCGISPADFTTYNPSSTLCSSLVAGEHVCCSAGTLPDFAPKPNSDGSCYAYNVVANDNCATLSANYDLTNDLIESFNNDTWGWQGCGNVLLGAVICLSTGAPPVPAILANAVCGPQAPGTVIASGDTYNISGLNPCALNACCDIWGQCGTTDEFCVDTSLGPPGTAKNGTYGCISNCGTDIITGPVPASPIVLGYYEGYGMDRSCLYQDISQLPSGLTHVHFAFATLDPSSYAVSVGSVASGYEFDKFVKLGTAVHRVLTIGGWSFSTDPSTYSIFRNGVTSANRVAMATAIANFITQYDLDGVDIDWEYPGAPDIPGIPAASLDDGANYLDFLIILKNLLPGKTVSIAAPSSYWYLKQFPIQEISEVVDYIVYMTYDLHGQWDSGNNYAQDGCTSGTCLRSHVNLTETLNSLSMITKAGVPAAKVITGVTSYGRSFGMTDPSCYGPECTYGGTAGDSTATPGPCTDTAGYLADAEIYEIISGTASTITKRTTLSSRVNQYYTDNSSNSQILVYDNDQWVSFLTPELLVGRKAIYNALGMGGSTNWAVDLEQYNEPPGSIPTWMQFLEAVNLGLNPTSELSVDPSAISGNWTTLTCTDPAVVSATSMSPTERWAELDGIDAWNDVINVWKNTDRPAGDLYLSESISNSINGPEDSNCGVLGATSNCDTIKLCKDFEGTTDSGPAAYELWNSLVYVHEMYETVHDTIIQAASLYLDPTYALFEDTFAPVVPPDNTWQIILTALIGAGSALIVSSAFTNLISEIPYFVAAAEAGDNVVQDNLHNIVNAVQGFGAGLTGLYIKANQGTWTTTSQDTLTAYLGLAVDHWANITEQQLASIFSGTDDSLTVLADLVAGGQMLEGSGGSPNMAVSSSTTTSIEKSLLLSFYSMAIPTAWGTEALNAFVLDTGSDCSDLSVADEYVSSSDQKTTQACVNNKLYFLVYPKGSASSVCADAGDGNTCTNDNKFTAPAGADALDGTSWGGITITQLVTGSLNSYAANGNANGGTPIDPTSDTSIASLVSQDITAAGYINFPVCSGEYAFSVWEDYSDRTLPNWPCYIPPPKSDCQSSSFIDQTSDASPSVDDCMQIVNNIVGTDGEWTTQVVGKNQRQLVSYGSCKFGVQATDEHGNVNFVVAAQDIVDIITDSIQQFGGSGKIGAKGYMDCSGNINSQDIEWGLY